MPTPKFIQGTFTFEGKGLDTPIPLGPRGVYQVPPRKRSKLIYVRAGNSTGEMVSLLMTRNSRPLRYFPIGAKSAIHVSLAVTEDIVADSELEILIVAPEGLQGTIIADFGLIEMEDLS